MTGLDSAWRAVETAPDDSRALSVLADALLDLGDVHGELIRLQLEGRNDEAFELIGLNGQRWLGDESRLFRLEPAWKNGFIDSARLAAIDDLVALIGSPVGRLVRSLTIEHQLSSRLDEAIELLLARAPAALNRLRFGTERHVHFTTGTIDLEPLIDALPLLSVDIRCWPARIAQARSDRLEHLALSFEVGAAELAASFDSARLPRLSTLELTLPFERVELPEALLVGATAPSVRTLILRGVLWPEQVQALAYSPLLAQVGELRLRVASETGWHEALVTGARRFAHLRSLDIRGPTAHEEWESLVKDALPQVTIRHGDTVA